MILREHMFLDFIDSLCNDYCIFVESEKTLYGDIDEFYNDTSIFDDLDVSASAFPFYSFTVSINNGKFIQINIERVFI